MPRKKPSCFVIMPFGKKRVSDFWLDFDLIWKELFCPAAQESGFEAVRVDERLAEADINKSMMMGIIDADIAIVDITYHNPNVYYELGIRHALSKHGTVLVKHSGGKYGVDRPVDAAGNATLEMLDNQEVPFDLRSIAHFRYQFSEDTIAAYKEDLKKLILARYTSDQSDSLVHSHIPNLKVSRGSKRAPSNHDRLFHILDDEGQETGKKIGFRSGDIARLDLNSGRHSDYWVSSENTNMQMARVPERSMSSTLRHLAGCDPITANYRDVLQPALDEVMGNKSVVNKGEVLITDSGYLRQTHGVQAILHAATVTGAPGKGFTPIGIEDMRDCIENILSKARYLNRTSDDRFDGRSIVMPLFGTGQGNGDPAVYAGELIWTAMSALELAPLDLGDRDIHTVWFMAYSEEDVKLMRRVFGALEVEEYIKGTPAR